MNSFPFMFTMMLTLFAFKIGSPSSAPSQVKRMVLPERAFSAVAPQVRHCLPEELRTTVHPHSWLFGEGSKHTYFVWPLNDGWMYVPLK